MEEFVPYVVAAVLICTLVLVVEKVPRSNGTNKKIEYHIAFLALALLVIFLVPESIQTLLFCPAGVLLIGTLIPIYESIKAIVSIDEEDDVAWLQFWVTSGEIIPWHIVCFRFGRRVHSFSSKYSERSHELCI